MDFPTDDENPWNDAALKDLEGEPPAPDAGPTYDSGGLPPRVLGTKKRPRNTFQTAIEEPRPKRVIPKEFAPVEAEPAGPRDHLFFLFALALIPLAVSIFMPQRTLAEIIVQRMQDGDVQVNDAGALDPEQIDEFLEENGGQLVEAHLSEDTWMHWLYAALATLGFLGLLVAICGRSASPLKLLMTGLLTGTVGIVMLLAFQWFAMFTRGIWFRGGVVAVLMLVVKFIGFSYICAFRPDTGFFASFFGFTFGVGLCEELCKAIPVLWYVNSPQANWKGAMLVGMASGIGFGISEGIMYSADMYNGFAGGMIYLVRFTSCVTLHAVWAGAVGLLMFSDQTYCTDIDWEAALMFVLKYLSIAMVLHGLYDTLLKKEYEVWALAIAVASWMWLAMLFYQRRAQEAEPA